MIIFKPPVPIQGAPNLSKGQKVFDLVTNLTSDQIVTLRPAASKEAMGMLIAVHEPSHVTEILCGVRRNGYNTVGGDLDHHSIESCRIIERAALMAIETQQPIFAPVSGFHHAGYDFCHGYCTFNGLVMAAEAARCEKPGALVLIIDGDGHWGDGTENLIERGRDQWLWQLSLDKGTMGTASNAERAIEMTLARLSWDLVIYQAGADAHVEDPYGVGYLTDRDWDERDALVFSLCRDRNLPLVFNLAGGYNGSKTLSLHARTVSTARRMYRELGSAHLSPEPSHA